MKRCISFFLFSLILLILLISCENSSSDTPHEGTAGGPCHENGTCNTGLVCYYDMCVPEGVFPDSNNFGEETNDEGSSTEDPDQNENEFSVIGFVQKGPFIKDSSIKVTELDENFEMIPTTSFTTKTIDNLGNFTIERKFKSRYIEIEANGYYYDEVTGEISTAPITNYVFVDLDADNSKININSLTTLERKRVQHLMKQGSSFTEARKQAEKEILEIFGIFGESTAAFQEMNILQTGDSNAMLLAISARLQGNNSPGDLSNLLSGIIYDIEKDGILDDSALRTALTEGGKHIGSKLTEIRKNLLEHFQHITTVTIPVFEDYCDNDGDDIINKWEFDLDFAPQTKAEMNTTYTSENKVVKINPFFLTQATARTNIGTIVVNNVDSGMTETTVKNDDLLSIKFSSLSAYNTVITANVVVDIKVTDGPLKSWSVPGSYTIITVECDDGNIRNQFCGLNNNGALEQSCQDRMWVVSGTCNDPDICLNGDTRQIDCVGGKQQQLCTGGKWSSTEVCQCTDGNPLNTCGTCGTAPQEVCDGKDNNCNGSTDEGTLCNDGNPCTTDTCNGTSGCSSINITCPPKTCQTGTCNPSSGGCEYSNLYGPITGCSGKYTCQGGSCVCANETCGSTCCNSTPCCSNGFSCNTSTSACACNTETCNSGSICCPGDYPYCNVNNRIQCCKNPVLGPCI